MAKICRRLDVNWKVQSTEFEPPQGFSQKIISYKIRPSSRIVTNKISLFTLDTLEKFRKFLSAEDIKAVIRAEKVSKRECDTEIAEKIGERLLKNKKIKEFKELMLHSQLPEHIF